MPTTRTLKRRAGRITEELTRLYPEARCELDYDGPLQLLVATILSAQCTDRRVNTITPALFARYPDAAAFADADPAELERMIHSTGFFRAKARSIMACCREIVERHGGRVPGTMEDLVALTGLGRKSANVILGNAFGVPGLPVDTHVGRLSRRLGLTAHPEPVKVEADLSGLVPREGWTMFAHLLIWHGRRMCHARNPQCDACPLARLCPRIGVGTAVEDDAPEEATHEDPPRTLLPLRQNRHAGR